MNKDVVFKETEAILELLINKEELDGTTINKIVESTFINQIAGTIVAKNKTDDKEKDLERHYQLVTIISDYIKVVKHRFMTDPQIVSISNGEILDDITLFSERLLEADMDDIMLCDDGTLPTA